MKKLKYLLLLIASLFISCEEVVDADLDTAPPRLVVEASIDWVKGTEGSVQAIKLTTTTGYYETAIPVVNNAEVYITNNAGNVFDFFENEATGIYICTNFAPQLNETYTLTVISNGQTYTATEVMQAVPDIKSVAQTDQGGFLGEDIEVRFFYDDAPGQDNYYLTRFEAAILPFPEYELADDEFFEGNEMFEIFSDEDFKPQDTLKFRLHGISERYYDYMNVLLSVAGSTGNPFQAVPTGARGNVVNAINQDDYALGYFRLCQVSTLDYVIQ